MGAGFNSETGRGFLTAVGGALRRAEGKKRKKKEKEKATRGVGWGWRQAG